MVAIFKGELNRQNIDITSSEWILWKTWSPVCGGLLVSVVRSAPRDPHWVG